MRKVFYFALVFLLGITAGVNAQVTIGADADPHAGAVLDLRSNNNRGLLLPKVELSNVNTYGLVGEVAVQAAASGMIVYNTKADVIGGTGVGVYVWDGAKWAATNAQVNNISISPEIPTTPIDPEGGQTGPYTPGDSPACASGYTVSLVSGSEYATITVGEGGDFSLTFDANRTNSVRSAVVMVMNACTASSKHFVFQQAGAPCESISAPTISQVGTSLCTGGAVYLSVPAATANLEQLVWTRNGIAVGEGTPYLIVTQPGTYSLSMGAVGCNPANSITVTQSGGTASQPVATVLSSNGGILCGTSGSVTLTAMGNPSDVKWFRNGALSAKTGNPITLNGGATDAGDWFAVVSADGSCYSKPSNIQQVVYNDNSVGQVALDPSKVKVNGVVLASVTSFCPGSSLTLTVDDPTSGVTYTWYNGNEAITSPYTVPSDQSSILLRLVATDNSGALCPAEAASAEKTITGESLPVAVISGESTVCTGSSTTLVVNNVSDADSFEWFRNGVSVSSGTNNSYAASAGNYTVRYTKDGCVSPLSTVKAVASIGAPEIAWNEFVAEANETSNYTFSVRSTGTNSPTGYTWVADPSGNAVITGTGNTVSVKFTGSATISVTPESNCGAGSPITKSVSVISASLPAVTIVAVGGGTSFCNAVTFRIIRPGTGWTNAEWTALSANNVTATRAGSNYAGTLTSDGTDYYFSIPATAPSQTASITVSGTIGSKPITSATSGNVTITTTTGSSFALVGTTCFDIALTDGGATCGTLASRTPNKAKFGTSNSYDYNLTGALGSGVSISNVSWSYTNPSGAVISFVPATSSATLANNKVTMKFDDALLTNASIGANGIQVKVTATVTTSGGSCGIATYTVEQIITIKDCQCCPGYLAQGGEYTTTKTGYLAIPDGTTFATLTSATWGFKSTGKDLCFYKKDGNNGAYTTWANGVNNCANGNYVDAADRGATWRLPNIAELGAIQSKHNSLASQPTSASGTTNLLTYGYWSSTEYSSDRADRWNFASSSTHWHYKPRNFYVRCVRSLNN